MTRLELHLKKVARVLPLLEGAHTPIYRIELDANRPSPQIHVGAGPFGWIEVGRGVDQKGPYLDYAAHLRGVELHRRVRDGRPPKPFHRPGARFGDGRGLQ